MGEQQKLKQRLIDEVETRKDELIELCSSLLKIPSENPPGDSTAISHFIAHYLKQYGLEIEWHESHEKMFNLLSSIGSGRGRELIYCGHTDVVPVGDHSKWDFDPFSGEVKDGWLLGRGASDMKAGLGGIIYAFALLKRLKVDLPGKLTLAIVPDEETGGEYGVPWLLEKGLIKGDGCLIAEPSSPLNPTLGQKGSYWFELDVFGQSGHGSLSPLVGKNAITDAILAIEKIRGLWDLKIVIPKEVQELVKVTKEHMVEVGEEREKLQPAVERITVNIGTINGGTKSNIIPESCKVQIDSRLPFGVTHDDVTNYLKKNLDELGIRYKIRPFGFRSIANFTPPDDPVCQAIVDNISFVTGKKAYGVMQTASSDARHFRDHQIPVLQYGPAYLPSIHGRNEKVLVEDVIRCAKVYIAAVIDFLFGE